MTLRKDQKLPAMIIYVDLTKREGYFIVSYNVTALTLRQMAGSLRGKIE